MTVLSERRRRFIYPLQKAKMQMSRFWDPFHARSRKAIHHLLVEVSSHWTLAYSSIARHFNQIVFPAILFSARFSFWHSLITQHCRRNYGTLISCHILVFHSFLNHGGREIKFLCNCNYHLPDRLTCPSFHFSSWSLWVFVLSCSVTGLIKLFFSHS